ncbi:cytochrome D1 domain-containing protein [Aquitalea pelogenes]|uniref:YVTN family beta-propeller repeat protein n=1 Tax=Aquitalea pelogenes TaxID=1293573 RepID=UPI0009EC2459|nr:cytochrome D1 domain-containing protein [Aquitalea pelogenes]
MKTMQFILAASLLAISTPFSNAAALPKGQVYSANEGDNTISVITLPSGKVNTVTVPITPHNVQISPDGKILLAVGMPANSHNMVGMDHAGGHDEDEPGQLLLLDADQPSKILAIMPAGHHPAHVITDPTGQRAYITSSEDNAITVIDLRRKVLIAKVATGAFPHGLRASPNGSELYVANVKDDSVSVIDTKSLKEIDRIHVGHAPVQVGFSPDGRLVYVSLRDDNQIAVIDTTNNQITTRVAVGKNPIQVFASNDGNKVYVANQGSDAQPDDKVSILDARNNVITSTVTTGLGAHGVVVSPGSEAAFITNTKANTVSVINAKSGKVIANYSVGNNPNGITFRAY